jgi:hypothetical protein
MRARYSDPGLSASINFEKAHKTPVSDDRRGSMAEGQLVPWTRIRFIASSEMLRGATPPPQTIFLTFIFSKPSGE